MCVTCLANPGPATAGRPMAEADDDATEARRWRNLTAAERHREWLAINAARPVPFPVCRICELPHDERDGHPLIDGVCESCGGNIFEEMAWNFIFARNKRARRRAAKRLRDLAYS